MFLIENKCEKYIVMAEGGEFGYEDKALDKKIDNDDDERQEANTTKPFEPYAASTPYHDGEKHEMQTMQDEQSGLPDTSFVETPLLSGSIRDADIERRLAALRHDPITGIINTTQMMDTSINPLSEEDRAKQIEIVKKLIKTKYPNVNFDRLPIGFSKKRPMDIVALGPRGGETKIVLNDGSALQQSFLNLTYVKKALGPSGSQIAFQQRVDLDARKKELEVQEADYRTDQQIYKQIGADMKDIGVRIDKKEAKVAQLKEEGGNEEEVKREEQVIKNLKKDFTDKQKDKEVFQKKMAKIAKEKQVQQQTISERERKINEIEENFYSMENFDDLKEEKIRLLRLIEKDQAAIDDPSLPELLKNDARTKIAARNEEIARIQTRIDERVAEMPLRERVREIFKKYGVTVTAIFLAAGVTIGAVVGAITNALKTMGNQLANGLKTLGAKAASALPGLIGSIVSFLFKTAGQAIGFLAEHTWLLILAVVVFIFEKYIKRR